MRDFLKTGVRRFSSAWFWSLVLLALPNCSFDASGTGPALHLDTGALPHSSAIMCDIEKFQAPSRRCATAEDLMVGIPLTAAAEALVSGRTSNVGLDYSPDAQADCGVGNPKAIDFRGPFPEGFPICLNCGVIPVPHADATAVCVAQCQDLVNYGGLPVPPDVVSFCTTSAHPSTNFPTSGCFANACSNAGTLRDGFEDPRRIPEPVMWTDFIGTSVSGSLLGRIWATNGNFDAGAASTQWIHANDGHVEFEASEKNLSHIVGFSQVSGACPFPCPDIDPSFADITFAISLNYDGRLYVIENGALVMGLDLNGSFGTYVAGERFRVKVTDNFDGTAAVTYSRIVGPCVPGKLCNETVFHTHVGSPAVYPLRVDASFREQTASLANVNIVRIQ